MFTATCCLFAVILVSCFAVTPVLTTFDLSEYRRRCKCVYNRIVYLFLYYAIEYKVPFNNAHIRSSRALWKQEAYWKAQKFNQQKCPISLKEFDSTFDEALLNCGHRFDSQQLNQYEDHCSLFRQYHGLYECPLCRGPYHDEYCKFNYNHNFYSEESLFYDTFIEGKEGMRTAAHINFCHHYN